ncbi:unnamed protein product, partial [Onchocerca flexuosa]|uniref:GYF domain-containing protein n=1 Tax=Onchocerca flexuosa TaxID=387005 RepID=A0A183I7C0_9BILA
EQRANGSTSKSSTAPIIDYSSLDAFLDGSLFQEKGNMSKSTKEWRSSFSTMRNRFGNFERSPDEAISNTYDFTTNGSKTLPTRTLAKSASQGSLTFSEHSDSSQRRRSLLANAVERRRAAEAPELRPPASRRELGDFWAATIKNRSALSSSINGAILTHSPSPDATSDTSSTYNAPSGLPHPKPKHNIREQLIQAGFEPRGGNFYFPCEVLFDIFVILI